MGKINFINKTNFSSLENYKDETKVITAENVNEIKHSVNQIYDIVNSTNSQVETNKSTINDLKSKSITYDSNTTKLNKLINDVRSLTNDLNSLSHNVRVLEASAGFRPKLVYRGTVFISEKGSISLRGSLNNWNNSEYSHSIYALSLTLIYNNGRSYNHSQMFSRAQVGDKMIFTTVAIDADYPSSNTSVSLFSISGDGNLKHEHDGSLYANDDKLTLNTSKVVIFELL
ncbi:hypothetical protein HLA87_02485 [Mycoplasma miroungigenitalium]|uniref:Uncharacterized protein n=1 Tax=Mycoplasma miroungigenitalium TaxID=754515 RepID=A0A6M4JEY8_9MOLU|nr:hypothetical protein [Mycoplasma miroungigenitalium]QJR43642.1 hypothetical protein HLA87_02485 [Mycoplasma miroungigenitalium]